VNFHGRSPAVVVSIIKEWNFTSIFGTEEANWRRHSEGCRKGGQREMVVLEKIGLGKEKKTRGEKSEEVGERKKCGEQYDLE
jgi:hypothetical protein